MVLQLKRATQHAREHFLLTLAVAVNYSQIDMEKTFISYLLAQSTWGCDYPKLWSRMMTATYAAMLLWYPVSAVITDTFRTHANIVMRVAALFQLVTELLLFCVPPPNVPNLHGVWYDWFVVCLQLIRLLSEVQLYNSIWKVFKLRLEGRFHLGVGSQCAVLSSVGLLGELIDVSVNAVILGLAFWMVENKYTFVAVRNMLFFTSVACTFCVVVLSFVTTQSYYLPDEELAGKGTDNDEYIQSKAPLMGQKGDSSVKSLPASEHTSRNGRPVARVYHTRSPEEEEESLRQRSRVSNDESLCSGGDAHSVAVLSGVSEYWIPNESAHSCPPLSFAPRPQSPGVTPKPVDESSTNSDSVDGAAASNAIPVAHGPVCGVRPADLVGAGRSGASSPAFHIDAVDSGFLDRAWAYTVGAATYTWKHRLVRHTILHSMLVFLGYSVFLNAESIALPGRHVIHHKTLDNFCGNYMRNTLYQQCFMNASFGVGLAFYLIVLKIIRPFTFFQYVYPVGGAAVLACCILVFFDLSQMFLSIFLGFVVAFLWFFYVYDTFLATALIAVEYYGFYAFLNGYVKNISNFIVLLLMAEDAPNKALLFGSYVVLLLSMAYAVFVARSCSAPLKVSSLGYC